MERLKDMGVPTHNDDWDASEIFDAMGSPGLISTEPESAINIHYNTKRKRAWRNMMVAGINAGIDQRLFSVLPGDNRWPGYLQDIHNPREAFVYEFTFGNDVPALASVGDAGYDELSIHVALWPTDRKWVSVSRAGFYAGEAFACGWLERKQGAWLQSSPERFNCRNKLLSMVSSSIVSPKGFGDRGAVIL